MILKAQGLAYGYPGRRIGGGVDLSLQQGEALALLGPNGGGKTTLLKTLLGLLPPQAGRVCLDGRPLADWPPRERAQRMAYVPQAHAGAFAFSVEDVVLMGRTARQGLLAGPSVRDREIALGRLSDLGMSHLAGRPYTDISGGERQLVLIARALAQEPAIIILDEPTASLDFGNQGKVMRQIRALAGRGLAVLFTTHDPNQALRHADRVALLAPGGLVQTGTPAAILQPDALEALYGAPVLSVGEAGERAFLPG